MAPGGGTACDKAALWGGRHPGGRHGERHSNGADEGAESYGDSGGRRKHVFQGVIRFVQRKGRSHKREISDGLRRVYKFPVLFRRNCRHSQPQGPD